MNEMKIALPTDDGKNISEHFGRCKEFKIIKNTEEKTLKNNHDEILPAVRLNKEGVNVVVIKNIGEGAKAMLKKYNIKMLKAEYDSIDENVQKIDKLKEL